MADSVQKLTLDSTDLIKSLATAQQAFADYNKSINQTADVTINITKAGEKLRGTFTQINEDGVKVAGTFRRVNDELVAKVKSIKATDDALRQLNETQRAANLEAAKSGAQEIFKDVKLDTSAPERSLGALARAQKQLVQALTSDSENGLAIAKEIFAELQKGVVNVEVGVRQKIQGALIGVLNVNRQITAELDKQTKANRPIVSTTPDASRLGDFRSNILSQFPVPSQANLNSVFAYQAALNNLISIASRGKVELGRVQDIFSAIAKAPTVNVAKTVDEQRVEAAAQRVIAAHRSMQASSRALEEQGAKTGQTLFLSFDQFVKLLEIQIVHRIFGALITGMQQSIGEAARLQVSISEIRTIAQSSGLSFGELQQVVRQTSEEFNRPQVQVAEALYQGFSNQIVKTSADMFVLNEAMRLSRITVSDAKTGMEALNSTLNAFSLSNENARQVSDELFKAVEIGKFRLQDIAGSIGRVNVAGSQLGVTRQEILGLLAGLTRNGLSASEAMTQISSIMQALLRPTTELKSLFSKWGVDSGQAAIQTFGFVEVLQKLFAASQSGVVNLQDLFNNVRALRGVLGATTGGGTGSLRADIETISNARESADAAAKLIGESAGEKFLSEINKIKNFFINDFANNFIETAHRLAEPFGGLSNAAKGFGNAVILAVGQVTGFLGALSQVVTLGGTLKLDLGVITQLYLSYKAAVIAITVAKSAELVVTKALAAAELERQALIGARVSAGASAAEAEALVASKAAIAGQTAALGVLSAAMRAIPYAAVAAGIFLIIEKFQEWHSVFKDLEGDIARLSNLSNELRENFAKAREEQRSREQRDAELFAGDLRTRAQAINRVIANLQQQANELVSSQAEVVRASTSSLTNAIGAAHREMERAISDITSKINKAKSEIEKSDQAVSNFEDRERSRGFQAALHAAGEQPEIHSGLRPLDPQQQQQQNITRAAQLNSLTQQRGLIERRILELTTDAQQATLRGDDESIQRARHKYEEIRRLTEQLWRVETQQAKQTATNAAIDLARATGGTISTQYKVDLDRLTAMLDNVRRQEEQTERAFKRRQEEAKAALEQQRKEAEEKLRTFDQSVKDLQGLKTTNARGDILPQFQGAQGLSNFERQFDEIAQRIREAARASGISPEAQLALETNLQQQRANLRVQIERQITQQTIVEIQRRAAEEERIIAASRESARTAAQQARGALDSLSAIPQQVGEMQRKIDELKEFLPSIFNLTPTAIGTRAAFDELVRQFNAQRELVEASTRRLNGATDEEKAAIAAQLERQVAALSDIFRRLNRISAGDQPVAGPGSQTGNQVSRAVTTVEQTVQRATEAANGLRVANEALRTAEARSANLLTQLQNLPGPMQAVATGMGNVGVQGIAAGTGVTALADALKKMNDEIQRLQAAQPIRLPAMPPAPREFLPNQVPIGEFAEGGLIGGRFTGRGPDNRLIFAREGEMIINSESTRTFYAQLLAINAGRMPKHYAAGGVVHHNTYGDINISVDGSRSPSVSARAVMREIQREKRRGTGG